jgi:hypothetical protein
MATLRQAARANMTGWQPAPAAPAATTQAPSIPQKQDPGRLPTMLASMPLMASTGDAFARQFYGAGNNPSYRILPAKRGAGA